VASPIVNRFCLTLSFALAIAGGRAHCAAQSNLRPNISSGLSQLPKLCKPVSFRYGSSIRPIRTKIGMLGDRYEEVAEALRGWNESGVPLVGKFNNDWEAVPCGDDTGLFYIVPLLARRTGWSADRSLDVFLFGLISASAMIGLAGLWVTASRVWTRVFALVPIMVASFLSYKAGDVYVIQESVVLMLLPWLVYALKPDVRRWLRFFIIVLSGFTLGLAQWIRTQSGSPVLLFFAVLLCFSSLRRSIRILLAATLVICMSLPLLYARFPLRERDRFLALHQPGYQAALNRHLFWHTAYLGLGYLTNPYVAAFRDSVAVEYVEAIDPAAIYGGEEYEKLLRSRVKEIVNRDHKFVFYTLAAKAGVLACMLVLFINFGLAAAILRPKSLGTELAFWLALSFAAIPGIVAVPVPQYVLGMTTLALLYWYYTLDFYLSRNSDVPEPALGAS
jgi:hypothetical protein